ncbi:ABC transporter substrate-binding protein [Verminephrobacter aporrectodeae subsp. tuberculatae]|uniref:ABC transporter substrate-binding protein n=1 Tax=Verminephrobacter aporrectodeae TaxID=1110389 RepID=UPI002242E1A9|nr:ABC transporter substrate-binding protein [Verminephrobacter aporrectodeae]MCW8196997.1 ABC transporter substrate-binding protein [Verminephrobacter aporrectodeae subsp. tuberculatae]
MPNDRLPAGPAQPACRPAPHTLHAARMDRRRLLAAAAVGLPWIGMRSSRAQEATIRIGQSVALTGAQGENGTALAQGAKAAFAAINARGGVHGRSIELLTQDDAYEVPKAVANMERFLADRDTFALFTCMGTPTIGAMMPKVIESGIPFFAPFTGAQLAHPKNARNVFNIRASYADETSKLMQHLVTIGIQRIGVAYMNNAFGQEVLNAAKQFLDRLKLPEAIAVPVDASASDAGAAAAKLAGGHFGGLVLGLAGLPTLEFVKAMRAIDRSVTLYALSVSSATVKAMGANATGLVITQVVPLPSNVVTPVVRDFQAAWKASGVAADPTHAALEGYINARVFAEALQRAGRNPTRAAFIEATWSLKKWDLGGYEIDASTPERSASRFVEITMVGPTGRFVR